MFLDYKTKRDNSEKIYVDIPNEYLNWFRSRIYLSLYDLDLLKPNITYKIKK